MIAGVALGGTLTACGQTAAPAGAVRPDGPTPSPSPTATPNVSDYYAGYTLKSGSGSSYTSISATWIVPIVQPTEAATSDSNTWIGFDGGEIDSIPGLQVGTQQMYNAADDSLVTEAYWKTTPQPGSVESEFTVNAGDSIFAEIEKLPLTQNQFRIYLLDQNSGQHLLTTATYGAAPSTASFVEEDPEALSGRFPLALFGSVTFRNARLNGSSPNFTLADQIGLIRNGVTLATPSSPNAEGNAFTVGDGPNRPDAPATPLFKRHTDGSVWEWTGVPCTPSGICLGWRQIGRDPKTISISAGAGTVYARDSDGSIWEWLGGGCSTSSVVVQMCPSWLELDNNAADIMIRAGAGTVWQLHSDGTLWRSTGEPCNNTVGCGGWTQIDKYSQIAVIAPGMGTLFQMHIDGSVWRWTGAPCGGLTGCRGWALIDNDPHGETIIATSRDLFELREDGSIWQWTGALCSGSTCNDWTEIDHYPPPPVTLAEKIALIAASGPSINKERNDGTVWLYLGLPCPDSTAVCTGWFQVGTGGVPNLELVASPSGVFRLGTDGTIWEGGKAWLKIDNSKVAVQISGSNGS